MYIKNRRNSSEVKVYSPFQYFCKLKDFCFEIAYFSYTNRWRSLEQDPTAEFNRNKTDKLKEVFTFKFQNNEKRNNFMDLPISFNGRIFSICKLLRKR